MTRFVRIALAGGVIALAAPATALAAPPTATTGNAVKVTQTTAELRGTIDPNGNPTFSYFQYGTTKLYGAQTPEIDRGSGNKAVLTADALTNLAPFETYHYRVVAQYGERVVLGKDRTFRTDRQPLGLSLAASPSTVDPNGSSTIAGAISGTGNGGRQVILQANPFPFSGFSDVGNPQIADAAGNFSFPVLSVPVNTVFRVRVPSKPDLASPEAPVTVRVDLQASAPDSVRRGGKVKFKGRVTPANQGAPIFIQRNFKGQWITVKRTQLGEASKFRTSIKPFRDGRFRVVVVPGAAYIGDISQTIRIDVKRKKRNR